MKVLDAQMQLRTCRHPAWPIATLGNCHCNNRVYSIQAGRWTTPDPVATPWWNMTSYVCCFLQLSDPTGLADSGLPPDPGHNSRNHLAQLEAEATEQGKCLYVSTICNDTDTIEYRIDDFPPDHKGKRTYWGNRWVSMTSDGIGECITKKYKFKRLPTQAEVDEWAKKLKAWEQEMKDWARRRDDELDRIERTRKRKIEEAKKAMRDCIGFCTAGMAVCIASLTYPAGPVAVAGCIAAYTVCEAGCRNVYVNSRDAADADAKEGKENWLTSNPHPPVPPMPQVPPVYKPSGD